MIRRASFPFPTRLLLAYVRAAFDANLNLLRNERRLGKSQRRLVFRLLQFAGLGRWPPPLPRGRGLAGFYFGEQGCGRQSYFFRKLQFAVLREHLGASLTDPVFLLGIPVSTAREAVGLWVLQQDAGRIHGLALFNRAVLQVLEGERDTNVPDGEFGTRQIKELAGPLWATGWPALSEHKKRILYQNFHADLWEQWETGRRERRKRWRRFILVLLHIHMYTNIHLHVSWSEEKAQFPNLPLPTHVRKPLKFLLYLCLPYREASQSPFSIQKYSFTVYPLCSWSLLKQVNGPPPPQDDGTPG